MPSVLSQDALFVALPLQRRIALALGTDWQTNVKYKGTLRDHLRRFQRHHRGAYTGYDRVAPQDALGSVKATCLADRQVIDETRFRWVVFGFWDGE